MVSTNLTVLSIVTNAGQLGLPVSREVVLEHIVERKRIDDLAGSIMDGRFAEQKVLHVIILLAISIYFPFAFAVSATQLWCASSRLPHRGVWRLCSPQNATEVTDSSCGQHAGTAALTEDKHLSCRCLSGIISGELGATLGIDLPPPESGFPYVYM